MSNRGIKVEKIRTLLKFDGITTDLTDDELEVLVESKLYELEGLVNADLYPHDRTQVTRNYYGDVYELDFYPLLQVAYVYYDDELLHKHHYNVNYDLGVIYFDDKYDGVIRVQYTTGIKERDFEYLVLPLIKDMVGYTVTTSKVNARLNGLAGVVNSMHEGDVSLSFGSLNGNSSGGNNYGYSPSVNTRIDELIKKYKCSARVKWL